MNKTVLKETKVVHKSDNLMMNVYRNRETIYLHWHDEYEFLYANSDCTVIVDGYTYTLNMGDVLLIEGGMLHSTTNSHKGSCTATVIHPHLLGEDCMTYFGNGISYQKLYRRGDSTGDVVIHNVTEINKCFADKKFGYELRIKSLVSDIFATLTENNCFTIEKKSRSTNKVLKGLIDLIHGNYKSLITLDSLCKASHYSRCYIIRLFKQHTGQTPIDYINSYRLTKATELLTNTDMSVLDVSLECGFENTGYFIKLFKNKFGTTHLKWKNGQNSI